MKIIAVEQQGMLKIVDGSISAFMMWFSLSKIMTEDELTKRLVMLKMYGIIMIHG